MFHLVLTHRFLLYPFHNLLLLKNLLIYFSIGDNPSVSSGAPISLGWRYDKEMLRLPLDYYEQYRTGHRRAVHQMKMPPTIRHAILRNWDVSTKDIYAAQRECATIKRQRNETIRKEERKLWLKFLFAKRLKVVGSAKQLCSQKQQEI